MYRKHWLAASSVALVLALVIGTSGVQAEDKAPEGEKKTEAPKLPKAKAFTLKDLDGKEVSLKDYKDKWVVLEWVNLGCPFVKKHYHDSHKHMQKLQEKYTGKGIVWLSICSTNPNHKDYMNAATYKRVVAAKGIKATKVLMDSDGKVGRAYGATRTPEMFVINPKGEIAYAGAIDDVRRPDPAVVPKARNYLVEALDAYIAGKKPEKMRTKPYGCSVKYAK